MTTPRWLQTFDFLMDAALPGERHPVGSPIPEPTYRFPAPFVPETATQQWCCTYTPTFVEMWNDYRFTENRAVEQWD